jgi:two-component system, OmpR family, response regulator
MLKTSQMSKILIVDDNFELTRLMNLYLSRENSTSLVFSLEQAIKILAKRRFDLLILDRILPDGDGLDLLKLMREKQLLMPVLILSNKSQVEERVRGLRLGADEYLGKPFSMDEFLLKVEKLIHTTKKIKQNEIHINQVTLFEKEGKVRVENKEVQLRPREFEILLFLARHANQVISRSTLIENLWGEENAPSLTTVDVYVRRIRMLLGMTHSSCLRTFRNYGYMIQTKK